MASQGSRNGAALCAASSDYEAQRNKRIAENMAKLQSLDIVNQARLETCGFRARRPGAPPGGPLKRKQQLEVVQVRCSPRLLGKRPAEGMYVDNGEDEDDERRVRRVRAAHQVVVGKSGHGGPSRNGAGKGKDTEDDTSATAAAAAPLVKPDPLSEELQSQRCGSRGRGSLYDSVVGICCHFCRQKKLCGEEGCQRCVSRDPELECIGKTNCSKCQSATGQFCRACLKVRYGQELEEARADPNWLCPHCSEEAGDRPYWICNSSICMKKRHLPATGIAIFDALKRGYPSVAHMLAADLEARGWRQQRTTG